MDHVGSNCEEYGSGIENGRILYTSGRDLQTQKIRKNLRIELYLRWNNDWAKLFELCWFRSKFLFKFHHIVTALSQIKYISQKEWTYFHYFTNGFKFKNIGVLKNRRALKGTTRTHWAQKSTPVIKRAHYIIIAWVNFHGIAFK